MKFKGFEEIDMSKQPEDAAPEAAKENPQPAEKPAVRVDRRPASARPKAAPEKLTPEEERDQEIMEGTAKRLLDETGHIADQKEVYEEALRWKFQGMPYEMFADKLVQAFMSDEDLAKKVADRANKELIEESKQDARMAPFRKLSNEDLAAMAVYAMAHDPAMAKEVEKGFNKSAEAWKKGQEERAKGSRLTAVKTVVDPRLKRDKDGSQKAA